MRKGMESVGEGREWCCPLERPAARSNSLQEESQAANKSNKLVRV